MKQFTTKCLKHYASIAVVIVALLTIVLGSFLYLNSQPLYLGKVETLKVGVSNVEPSFLI
jgi:hypothetical protein